MHGELVLNAKQFFNERYGRGTWSEILDVANIDRDSYHPTKAYPDEELVAIFDAAVDVTDTDLTDLQWEFGVFMSRLLFDMFPERIDDEWGYYDLLENTEDHLHRQARRELPNADPPVLDTTRTGPEEIIIRYTSDRRLCHAVRGTAHGMADIFNETVTVSEERCMFDGDDACVLRIQSAS